MTATPALRERGSDRRAGDERRLEHAPWSGRDRRTGLDRRKGERRRGFGRRAGALTVPRRFPAASVPVGRPRVVGESTTVVTALIALGIGVGYALVSRDIVTSYATETFAQAWSVWHVPAGQVPTMGYDQPPLLALLEIPFAFDTGLSQQLVLMPLVSVLVGAALAGIVHAVLAGFRVPTVPRIVATALLVLNPAWVYFTAAGLPTMGGMLAVLAGFYGLVNWLRFGNLLWVLVSSTALAVGVLVWYPVTTWAIGAVLLLFAVLVWRRVSSGELIGVLLVYVVPIAFTMGLWTLICWQAGEGVPAWLSSAPVGAGIATSTADFALLLAPLVLAVAVALALYAPRRPDVVGAGVVLFLLVPLFIAVSRRALDPDDNAGAGSLFYVILPSVAIVVSASVYAELPSRLRLVTAIALAACLLAGNLLLFDWMNDGEGRPVNGFAHLISGRPAATELPPVITVGRWLEDNAETGQVAIADSISERERNAIALMAGMPDLLAPGPRSARWRVLPARAPAPTGFDKALEAGDLAVFVAP